MIVTSVKLSFVKHRTGGNDKLKAYANIILDGQLIINAIKIIDNGQKRHLIFPNKRREKNADDGASVTISLVNPIVSELRTHITETVLEAFDNDPRNPDNAPAESSDNG